MYNNYKYTGASVVSKQRQNGTPKVNLNTGDDSGEDSRVSAMRKRLMKLNKNTKAPGREYV